MLPIVAMLVLFCTG